jgi:hypothetical protein
MNLLKTLYCKYYNFQVKFGNKDIAPFSSMLIIAFTIMLYYFSAFFLTILFIPKGIINTKIFVYASFSLLLALVLVLYFVLVHKAKYKVVLKEYENKKGVFLAAIFPLLAFLLFNASWILKMLQNQGKF